MTESYFLWLDLETTGLNPVNGAVLEVGWIFTRVDNLTPLLKQSFVVHCPNWRNMVDDFVLNMHTESGLADDLYKLNNSLAFIEDKILEHIHAIEVMSAGEPYSIYLAGGSIHFDRKWIDYHMKKLEKCLHYRMLDVTALKLAFGRHGLPPDKKAHRALPDAEESLEALVHYRKLVAYDLP